MIGPDGLLLVVSHLIAVLALVLLVGLEKSKELNLDVVAHIQSTVGLIKELKKNIPCPTMSAKSCHFGPLTMMTIYEQEEFASLLINAFSNIM
jgi:hypothetical protein